MKKSKAIKILENTAVKEGVSVADVRCEIQQAIDIGYANRNESNADFWNQWKRGLKPTVEEFIIATHKNAVEKIKFGGL